MKILLPLCLVGCIHAVHPPATEAIPEPARPTVTSDPEPVPEHVVEPDRYAVACEDYTAKLEAARSELAQATAVRTEWMKAHCAMVKSPFAGYPPYTKCDGKDVGDAYTIHMSKDEIALNDRVARLSGHKSICCSGSKLCPRQP